MDATAEQLASLVGLSSAAVSTLARRGVMIRGAPGKFALEESLRAYYTHLREAAAGQRGALVGAEAVAREWEGICRTVRAGMLRVPKRVAARLPHLTSQDVRAIDEEVRTALTELMRHWTDCG